MPLTRAAKKPWGNVSILASNFSLEAWSSGGHALSSTATTSSKTYSRLPLSKDPNDSIVIFVELSSSKDIKACLIHRNNCVPYLSGRRLHLNYFPDFFVKKRLSKRRFMRYFLSGRVCFPLTNNSENLFFAICVKGYC